MRLLKHCSLCLLLILTTVIHAGDLPQWQIIPVESELHLQLHRMMLHFLGVLKPSLVKFLWIQLTIRQVQFIS